MPINMNSPYIRAEVVPQSINDMGTRLKAHYGVGADSFGSKGNEYHDYGYHRSRKWILLDPDSRYGTSDYSVQTSRDNGGDEDWNRAFDFVPGVWGTQENRRRMIEITTRVYNAAKARDPRLKNMREFAGTLDGKNVITFNCADGSHKSPFDITHLDHCHGSMYTDTADADHNGIVDIMLGEDDDMGASQLGPFQLNADQTALTLPPVEAGIADPRQVWLNVGADSYGHLYALRIWASNGDGHWFAVDSKNAADTQRADGLYKIDNGVALSIQLTKGVRILTISRKAIDPAGHVIDASTDHPAFAGSISVCFERK